ncbi:hypothetical protein OROGR_023435 [Orobanche gracilis]
MVKDLELPVIIQGEDRVEGTIHWDELLEAADKANTDFIDEKVHQTRLIYAPLHSHQVINFFYENCDKAQSSYGPNAAKRSARLKSAPAWAMDFV